MYRVSISSLDPMGLPSIVTCTFVVVVVVALGRAIISRARLKSRAHLCFSSPVLFLVG